MEDTRKEDQEDEEDERRGEEGRLRMGREWGEIERKRETREDLWKKRMGE